MNFKRILLGAVLSAGMIFSSVGCSQSGGNGNLSEITLADGDQIAVIEIKDYGTMKAKLFPDIAPVGVKNFVELANQGYYNGLKIHRVVKDNVIQGGSLYGDGTGGNAAYTGEESIADATTFPIETSEKARNFYGALGYVADKYGQNSVQFYIVNNKQPQNLTKTDASKVQSKADELASEAEAATWEASSDKAKQNSYQQSYYKNNASMLSGKDNTAALKYARVGGVYQYDGGYTVFGQVYEGLDVLDKISEVKVQSNAQGEKSMPVQDIIISSVTIETFKVSTAEAESDTSSSAPATTAPTETASTTDTASDSLAGTTAGTAEQTAPTAEQSKQPTAEAGTSNATAESISTIDTKEIA